MFGINKQSRQLPKVHPLTSPMLYLICVICHISTTALQSSNDDVYTYIYRNIQYTVVETYSQV
jgi:hypothetical protein